MDEISRRNIVRHPRTRTGRREAEAWRARTRSRRGRTASSRRDARGTFGSARRHALKARGPRRPRAATRPRGGARGRTRGSARETRGSARGRDDRGSRARGRPHRARARRGSTRARERRNRRRRRRRGEGGAAHDEEHTSTPGASNNRAGLFPGRVDGREADRVNRECAGRSSRSDARECSSSARASAFAWRGRVPGGRSPDPLSPSPEAIIIFLAALLPSSILAHRPPSFFRGRIRFCGETTA